jgi:hypothetical protein
VSQLPPTLSSVQLFPTKTVFESWRLTFVAAGFAEHLNQHSAAINHKLDSEFEDWDFFADDFDNRVRCAHSLV